MVLEPSWRVLRAGEQAVQHLLLEVDDFLVGSVDAERVVAEEKHFKARFQFGK